MISFLPVTLCYSCKSPFVIPARPPLSFPQGVSGNPVSFSCIPLFVCPGLGKILDSRLQTSGMTERGALGMTERGASGITDGTAGMTDGMAGMTDGMAPPDFVVMAGFAVIPVLSGHSPLCHSRRSLAGIQCFSLVSLYSCAPAWENSGFPIKNVGNDRKGGIGNDRKEGIGNNGRDFPLSLGKGIFDFIPAGVPPSFPQGPLCYSRKAPSVIPAGC